IRAACVPEPFAQGRRIVLVQETGDGLGGRIRIEIVIVILGKQGSLSFVPINHGIVSQVSDWHGVPAQRTRYRRRRPARATERSWCTIRCGRKGVRTATARRARRRK